MSPAMSKSAQKGAGSLSGRGGIDLLHGPLGLPLMRFAFPLMLTGMCQQLFNTADVAVLGQLVGKHAMAAVGANVPVIGLIVGLFMGLSLGANVVIARHLGAGDLKAAARAADSALCLALLLGVGMMLSGWWLCPYLIALMQVPAEVAYEAQLYLQVFLWGMPGIALFNFSGAILRSGADAKTPLISLIIASVLNLVLNLVLVLGFDGGVAAVAAATAVANTVSALIVLWVLYQDGGPFKLKFTLRSDAGQLSFMVRIGLPAAVQGMVFSLFNLVIQSAINSLGADTVAASAAAFTIEINVYCVIFGYSQAITTFVSQNYGAGQLERCQAITRVGLGLESLTAVVISLIIFYFGAELLTFFSTDERVIELGQERILLVVLPNVINGVIDVLSGVLRGYGISLPPALGVLLCICGVRVAWVWLAFPLSPTYFNLLLAYPLSWSVTALMMVVLYRVWMRRIN